MRIFVIEDDKPTASMIQVSLQKNGYVVDITDNGEEGINNLRVYKYDLLVLDIMLPGINGYEILRRLRSINNKIPVLILSGLGEVDDRIKGLGFGADDYLVKPFKTEELIARVKAIIRRTQGHATSIIKVGRLNVDIDSGIVNVDGKRLELTGKEYDILKLMAQRCGSLLTKEVFLDHLYNGMDEPENKIIDVFICKLRKKLMEALGEEYIETIWGRGYMLREPSQKDMPNSKAQNDTPSKDNTTSMAKVSNTDVTEPTFVPMRSRLQGR